MPRQQEYRVAWEIDITADSPREAAEKVYEIMQDPEDALVFTVEKGGGAREYIDLSIQEEGDHE